MPDVLVQPHSASLGMTFYQGTQFPSDYQGDAFAAEHGSWNRSKRTGYKVIRIRMKDGKPTGRVRGFRHGLCRQRHGGVGAAGRRRGGEGWLAAGVGGRHGTIWRVTSAPR